MDLNSWINVLKERFGSRWVIILMPIIMILLLIFSAIGLSIAEFDKLEEVETLEVGRESDLSN